MLSDDEWAGIGHEVLHRTGLSPSGQDDEAVRWIAVRHGEDHIHIVAMLGRQDGGKPGLSGERYKVRAACLAAEQRYGLRSTAPADRTAARRPSRAESEKAARRGLEKAPRVTLRRQVTTAAAAANSQDEFFARLDAAGVLVRKRFSVTNPGQVTGYAVALPGDTAKDGRPVWYGGGKLATDLTWPKLRQRWTAHRATPSPGRLTAAERNPVWDHASRAAAGAAAQIRHLAWTNPDAAADAAWATSDTLHVAAAMLGSRILRQAADAYDRAARPPYGRIPPPTPAGNHPRQAARLLSAFACLTGDRTLAPIVLITRLAAPKPSPNCMTPGSMPPRPRPPAPLPDACTQPPARPGQRSRAQLRVPAPPPSLPHCPSPRPLPAASHPHPDSPALIIAPRGQHAGHLRPGPRLVFVNNSPRHARYPRQFAQAVRAA